MPRRTTRIQTRPAITEPDAEVDMVKAARLVQHLSSIVTNTINHYWLSDDDRAETVTGAFAFLEDVLKSTSQITVRMLNGVFTINGRNVEYRDSGTDALLKHLDQLAITNFYLLPGVTREEFDKLCAIFSSSPEELKPLGDFITVLEKFQIRNVGSKKLIFKELASGEVILDQEEFDRLAEGSGGPGEGGDGTGRGAGTGPGEGEDGDVAKFKALAGDILAFLKGDVSSSHTKIDQEVRDAASDPERLAELILQAADIREKARDVSGGETLGDFVVACLRKTSDSLHRDHSFHTAKGRKKAARDLLLIEEALLRRLREMNQDQWTEQDLDQITSATEAMTDEIKIDALADEYMTKRTAAEDAELRLLSAIRSEGIGPGGGNMVLDKLTEHGMPPAGWQQLVMRSGVSTRPEWKPMPGVSNARILEAIGHLDTVLNTLEKEFTQTSDTRRQEEIQKMLQVVQRVSGQIRELTTQTGLAIHTLLEDVHRDASTLENIEATMKKSGHLAVTRRDAFQAISRIIGEVMEPIELIRASLEMVGSKPFMDNRAARDEVIHMARDNVDVVKVLLDNLRKLSTPNAGGAARPSSDPRPA